MQFDVDTEKEILFDARDIINRYTGRLPIYDMPPAFDLTLVAIPSWKVGNIQNLFESCMSLAKDPDTLAKITNLRY